jgi:hypothetical protein
MEECLDWYWDSDDKLSESIEEREVAAPGGPDSSTINQWITTADSLPNPELDGSPEERMQHLRTMQLQYSVLRKWTAVLIAKVNKRKAPAETSESILASEALKIWYHPVLDAVLRRQTNITTFIPRSVRESISRVQVLSLQENEVTSSILSEHGFLISRRKSSPTYSKLTNTHSHLPPTDNYQPQPLPQGVWSFFWRDILDKSLDSTSGV